MLAPVGTRFSPPLFINVERHPDADRLVLADVEAGEHRLTVVTGAPNIAAGQRSRWLWPAPD
ncbi:MAG: hypothetical protein R2848_07955 [Thermomicrobiales bacterium]